MLDHLIIELDGSELAERVLEVAQSLAEKSGSAVALVRSIKPDPAIDNLKLFDS